MVASRLGLVCVLFLLPGMALADEELVSRNRAALPAAATAGEKTDIVTLTPDDRKAQFMSRLGDGPGLEQERIDYESWAGAEADAKKNRIHGSASVSVGTGGYSSASVSALIPVGDNGMLGIAYSQTDFGENGAYPFYDYGYPSYGADYDGYGHVYGRRPHRGTSQSFSLSYEGGSGGRSSLSDDCRSAFGSAQDAAWETPDDRRCFAPGRSARYR